MQGPNPAWIVLIGGDQDVQRACLSGRLIRSNFLEPVIAFVSEDFPCELTEAVQRSFDSVMVASKQPKHFESINIREEDGLLIQLLNMDGMFSSIVAIQPGILVFQSFQEILDHGKVILNREGNWKIVQFLPDRSKYERVLQLLLSGMPFNTTFIQHAFADFQREFKDIHENTAVSWCDLASYTG
ncbi:unnamed protein product [Orchesella dallaii]|uniref:Uncharacterized protein n=1 Tax=Orchesella dallaii TaxID=48710 RepID=A0ABP1RMF3_9HEXA